MTFDNTPIIPPTVTQQLRQHLPIALLALGVAALAIGIHLAAATVFVVAVAHIALGGFLLLLRRRVQHTDDTASQT